MAEPEDGDSRSERDGGDAAAAFVCEEEQAPPVEVSAADAAARSITVESGGKQRSCSLSRVGSASAATADARTAVRGASGSLALDALKGEVLQLEQMRATLEKTTCRSPAAAGAKLFEGFVPMPHGDPLAIRSSPSPTRPRLREFSPYRVDARAGSVAAVDSLGNTQRILPLTVVPRVTEGPSDHVLRASHEAHVRKTLEGRVPAAAPAPRTDRGWTSSARPVYPLAGSPPRSSSPAASSHASSPAASPSARAAAVPQHPPAKKKPAPDDAAPYSPGQKARRAVLGNPNLMVGIGRGLEHQKVRGVYTSPLAAAAGPQDDSAAVDGGDASGPPQPNAAATDTRPPCELERTRTLPQTEADASLVAQIDAWREANFAAQPEAGEEDELRAETRWAREAARAARRTRRQAEHDRLAEEYHAWQAGMSGQEAEAAHALQRMHAQQMRVQEGYLKQAAYLANKATAPLFHRGELQGMWQLERERLRLKRTIGKQEEWLTAHRARRVHGEHDRQQRLAALHARIHRRPKHTVHPAAARHRERADGDARPGNRSDPTPMRHGAGGKAEMQTAGHKWTWRDPSPLPAPPQGAGAVVTALGVTLPPPPLPVSPLAAANAAAAAQRGRPQHTVQGDGAGVSADAATQTSMPPGGDAMPPRPPAPVRATTRAGVQRPDLSALLPTPAAAADSVAVPAPEDWDVVPPRRPGADNAALTALTQHIKPLAGGSGGAAGRIRSDSQQDMLVAVGVLQGAGAAPAQAVPSNAQIAAAAAAYAPEHFLRQAPAARDANPYQHFGRGVDLALSPPRIRHVSTKQRKAPLLEFVVTRAAQVLSLRGRDEPRPAWTNVYGGHAKPSDYGPPGRRWSGA